MQWPPKQPENSVAFSREELYDLVWSTPMMRLAEIYDISDVGLAKTCRCLRVPRPPVGYWQRVAVGQKVARTKLGIIAGGGAVNCPYMPCIGTHHGRVCFPRSALRVARREELKQLTLRSRMPRRLPKRATSLFHDVSEFGISWELAAQGFERRECLRGAGTSEERQ